MDAVIGASKEIRKSVSPRQEFTHGGQIYLAYGIPVSATWTPRRLESGKPLRILYLGRLERGQKRVHLFPEIFRNLSSSGIPFVWTIVGEGPEASSLAEKLRSRQPSQEVRALPKI